MDPGGAFRSCVDLGIHYRLQSGAKESAALGEIDERELVHDAWAPIADLKVKPLSVGTVLDVWMDLQLVLVACLSKQQVTPLVEDLWQVGDLQEYKLTHGGSSFVGLLAVDSIGS